MPIHLNSTNFQIQRNGSIVFTMDYNDVPNAVSQHLRRCPSTPAVEALGASYVTAGFPHGGTNSFVHDVCYWGGKIGSLIFSLVKNANTPINMANLFSRAIAAGNAISAINFVTKINSLGISFGSKHLRMLKPDNYVVLDSFISKKLYYSLNSSCYQEFCDDCKSIAQKLTLLKITNPMAVKKVGVPRGNIYNWFPSDVEMALFSEVMNWSIYGKSGATPTPASTPLNGSSFDQFWIWLSVNRNVPTLSNQSSVSGKVSGNSLCITNSQGGTVLVTKNTCKKYFNQYGSKNPYGNERWVHALVRGFMLQAGVDMDCL